MRFFNILVNIKILDASNSLAIILLNHPCFLPPFNYGDIINLWVLNPLAVLIEIKYIPGEIADKSN